MHVAQLETTRFGQRALEIPRGDLGPRPSGGIPSELRA
jgi:hypothetical protein